MKTNKEFTPALGFAWATKMYDAVMIATMREVELRRRTAALVDRVEGQRILELGCGTGSLTWALAGLDSTYDVVGVDIDPEVLTVASERLNSLQPKNEPSFFRSDITDVEEMEQLELERFDTVITSLVLHHLPDEGKQQALQIAGYCLKPDGRLIVVDWGPGATFYHTASFVLVRLLDGFDVTRANVEGGIPTMLSRAGFDLTASEILINTVFGTVWSHTAKVQLGNF